MSATLSKNASPGTLILGGARSGKSRFAEELVVNSGLKPVYVATAEAGDNEMHARIDAHRARRGENWATVEEPLELVRVLREQASADRAVLVDCLTLWLSNLMFAERNIEAESADLADCIRALSGPVVFVSNEVGMGLVPDNRLGRDFRDEQGRLNQLVADACGRVVFVASGQPLLLKPSSAADITL